MARATGENKPPQSGQALRANPPREGREKGLAALTICVPSNVLPAVSFQSSSSSPANLSFLRVSLPPPLEKATRVNFQGQQKITADRTNHHTGYCGQPMGTNMIVRVPLGAPRN